MGQKLLFNIREIFLGTIFCAVIAIIAFFTDEQFSIVPTFYALLFGLLLNPMVRNNPVLTKGFAFTSRHVMRTGFVLVGCQISFDLLMPLGLFPVFLSLAIVVVALLLSYFLGKMTKVPFYSSLIASSSVAICGASAAMAVSSILPNYKNKANETSLIVALVIIVGSATMLLYPQFVIFFDIDDKTIGMLLGSTIHDIAQATMAGFAVSETSGEVAAFTKFLRVILLIPLMISITFFLNKRVKGNTKKAKLPIPYFILVFIGLIILHSSGLIPTQLSQDISYISKIFLTMAIAAHGLQLPFDYLKQKTGRFFIVIIISSCAILLEAIGFIYFFN